MRTKLWVLVLAVAALVALPGTALAQSELNAVDRAFVTRAAQVNEFAVLTGRLAQERAVTESVEEIATELVDDHEFAQAELESVVEAAGGETPRPALNPNQRRQLDRLEGLEGTAFEVAWLQTQVRSQAALLQVTQRAARRGRSRDVRELAIDLLPILGQHLGALVHQQDDLEREQLPS